MIYNLNKLEELLNTKMVKNLIFIHTPKCGGTYVNSILSHLNIEAKGHEQAILNDNYIYFTVIRNPVERFESLLNYRLDEKYPRNDWPNNLKYVYKDKNITLNEIVSKMTDSQILGFAPYRTLTYWTKYVDIIITIDQLPILLKKFDYTYDEKLFTKMNVSSKIRGKFNDQTKVRIKTLYNSDVLLYNKVQIQNKYPKI
jgi:hypothetical protein